MSLIDRAYMHERTEWICHLSQALFPSSPEALLAGIHYVHPSDWSHRGFRFPGSVFNSHKHYDCPQITATIKLPEGSLRLMWARGYFVLKISITERGIIFFFFFFWTTLAAATFQLIWWDECHFHLSLHLFENAHKGINLHFPEWLCIRKSGAAKKMC